MYNFEDIYSGVVEDCLLLAYDAASLVIDSHSFNDNHVFKMSGANYPATQHHGPEESVPHIYVPNND
jgi:hypothetical protein